MIIDIIKESDLQELAPVYLEIFNSSPWNDKWTDETSQGYMQELFSTPNFFGLVAREENEILGALMGNIGYYSDEKAYFLSDLFVKKRRHGVGRNLYVSARKKLKKEGITKFYYYTIKNSYAYGFYKALGAKEMSELIMLYDSF